MKDEELDRMLDSWQAPGASPSMRNQMSAAFPAGERGRILGVPVRWIVAGVLGAAFVALAADALTDGRLGGEGWGGADGPSGAIYAKVIGMVDPPIARLELWLGTSGGVSFGGTATGIRGSSWTRDKGAGLFYGVEFKADRMADGRYLVKTEPLSLERLQRGPFSMTGQVVPPPANAGPFTVAEGQSIDVDVYRSGSTRVFARIWFSSKPFAAIRGLVAPPMQFDAAKLYRNGVLLADWSNGSASGETMWFRLPGQGRYVMALDPNGNADFVAAGQVNRNTLEIKVGGDVYRVDSQKAIASGGARPVYVWHDAGFESELKPGDQEVMFGSSGKTCVFNGGCK